MVPHVRRRVERMYNGLDAVTAHADHVSRRYRNEITNVNVIHPVQMAGSRAVYVRYPLRVGDKAAMLAAAKAANVELADWYSTPVHPLDQTGWGTVGYLTGSCPEAEKRCKEVVTLPTHRSTSPRDIECAVSLLNRKVAPCAQHL